MRLERGPRVPRGCARRPREGIGVGYWCWNAAPIVSSPENPASGGTEWRKAALPNALGSNSQVHSRSRKDKSCLGSTAYVSASLS
jgi:hypothetical protein